MVHMASGPTMAQLDYAAGGGGGKGDPVETPGSHSVSSPRDSAVSLSCVRSGHRPPGIGQVGARAPPTGSATSAAGGGEAVGFRAIAWRHPARSSCRLPETPLSACAASGVAVGGRAAWRASVPDWIRLERKPCAGAVAQRRPREEVSDTEARSVRAGR